MLSPLWDADVEAVVRCNTTLTRVYFLGQVRLTYSSLRDLVLTLYDEGSLFRLAGLRLGSTELASERAHLLLVCLSVPP